MASAAVVGVTVRQVMTRSTAAAGSPQIRPTLSQGSASQARSKLLEPAGHVANGRHGVYWFTVKWRNWCREIRSKLNW